MTDSINVPWSKFLPTALKLPYSAYTHRHKIQRLWTQLHLKVGNPNTRIAILGRSGVGKSLLHSQMRDLVNNSFQIPRLSTDVERSTVTIANWARIVSVVPGQAVQQRSQWLHEIFHSHSALEGVIHVVDFGFNVPRNKRVIEKHIKDGALDTLEKWRQHNLEIELADFRKTCDLIIASHHRCNRPHWLTIAVNKCDLFWDNIDKSQKYYEPLGRSSPFTQIVRKLIHELGRKNLQVRVCPVSSFNEEFTWNNETTKSLLTRTRDRQAMFRHFMRTIASACEASDRRPGVK